MASENSNSVKALTPEWMRIAEAELGTAEVPGAASNPRIIEYHKSTQLSATTDEVPWCASFVGWCLRQAGQKGTHSAAARSYMHYGDALTKPEYGCVVVLSRGNSPSSGHVGFYAGEGPDGTICILGGNQGDRVSIARFSKSRVLAYRRP